MPAAARDDQVSPRAARRGLRTAAFLLGAVTVASVWLQQHTAAIAERIQATEDTAALLAQVATAALGYRVFYSVAMAGLTVALLSASRVPRATRAVNGLLGAAVAFGAAAALNLLSLLHHDAEELDVALVALLFARGVGFVALLISLVRLENALDARPHVAERGAFIAACLVDVVVSASRPFVADSGADGSGRMLLLGVQLAMAALFIRSLWRSAAATGEVSLAEVEPASGTKATATSEEPATVDEPEPEPDGADELPAAVSPRWRLLAALGAAVGVGLLPAWDLVANHRFERAELARLGGVDPPSLEGAWVTGAALLLGAIVAVYLWRALIESPYTARLACACALVAGVGYSLWSGQGMAHTRAQQVATWPTCRGETESPTEPIAGILGPHLKGGEPCVQAVERQTLGPADALTIRQGVVQIVARFPRDRLQLLLGTLLSWAALALAGAIAFRKLE